MTVREELEALEHTQLDRRAAFANETRGRLCPEEPKATDVRTAYQRDTDKIVHCKAFRRLMHKTQVFLQPEGDHYRTRMTHTLEVAAFGGIIRDTQFGAEVELEILVAAPQMQAFLDRITDMTSGTVEGLETGLEYRAFPVEVE